MRGAGHARAQLIAQVDAFPEEQAVDLTYILVPGPICVFGELRFEGVQSIQEGFLRARIDIPSGAPFDPGLLTTNQERLYRLGAFSAVTVLPVLDEEGQEIPILVQLQESRPRQMSGGFGFGLETRRWDLHGSFEWSHRNLFQRLVSFRTATRLGYAILPQLSSGIRVASSDHFPIAEQELELSWPQFPAPSLLSRALIRAELGLESGYKFVTPALVTGITWQPRLGINVDVSYNLEYWNYFGIQPSARELFCGEGSSDVSGAALEPCAAGDDELRSRDPYLLSYLEEVLTVDLRDDPVDTSRGFLGSLALAQAGLGGSYQYLKFHTDLRGYLPLWPGKLTLALRGRGGLLLPFGPRAGVPLSSRLYAGGAYDVRGWGSRGLPPPGGNANPQATPVGGEVVLGGSVELRARLHRLVSLASFFDVGRLYEDLSSFDLAAMQPTVGGGVRVHTPIGPQRTEGI